MAFPVRFRPVSQGSLIEPEFPGDIGGRAGRFYHHPGGFLPEFRLEVTALLPWYSIPSFAVKILLDPVRKTWRTQEECGRHYAPGRGTRPELDDLRGQGLKTGSARVSKYSAFGYTFIEGIDVA
jgi:hypothetical protein